MIQAKRHRRRAGRRSRWNRRRWRVAVLVAAAIAAAVVVAALPLLLTRGSAGPSGPRAAIVDQLSLTRPNPAFAQTATSILEQAGYAVDYYPGEQVSVDFFRELPTHRDAVLVLRVHSGRFRTPDGKLTVDANIFTGEPYSRTVYREEMKAGILARARHLETDPPSYFFAITDTFVRQRMKGSFPGTIVLQMGCNGLRANKMADAFVAKGARAVVGWDGMVSASHTDAATERLLQHLVVDKLDAQEAVARTMNEVGPDPEFGSVLRVYPPEAAASTIR